MTQHTRTLMRHFIFGTLVLALFAGYHISPASANKALSLSDSLDQYVKISNVNYSQLTDYTVEFWFKTSDSGTQTMFAATEAGIPNDHGIIIELQSDGDLRVVHRAEWKSSGGVDIQFDPDGNASVNYHDGEWHHV